MATIKYGTCRNCKRTVGFTTQYGEEESIQVGCQYCSHDNWPRYFTEYNSGADVWVIFKEYWITKKSWFGFGPPRDYLVTEVLRIGEDSSGPEIEFDTLKESKNHIKDHLTKPKL